MTGKRWSAAAERLVRGVAVPAAQVIGDRAVTVEDMRALKYTTRVINESMRLYPQPPVLIRRALEDDTFGDVVVSPLGDGGTWVAALFGALLSCVRRERRG